MTLRLHPTRSLSALLAVSAAASLIGASGAAFAQDRGQDDPVAGISDGVATDAADLDESAYDVPGEIVVDAKDDLDPVALAGLAADYGLSFVPTALEMETRIELAAVPASDESALLDRLARDPRVESA